MPRIPVNKQLDLSQLQQEFTAAGVPVPNGLGVASGELVTYDASGDPVELPTEAEAIVTAHHPSTALRDQLVSLLTSSVGVALPDLTNPQRLALIGALLYKAGGVNRQGQIRPLNQWLVP